MFAPRGLAEGSTLHNHFSPIEEELSRTGCPEEYAFHLCYAKEQGMELEKPCLMQRTDQPNGEEQRRIHWSYVRRLFTELLNASVVLN